jgi:hypothetical protein
VLVNSYFQAEENLKFGVFYLRPKAPKQEALLEVQEESLGIKKTNANAATNKGSEKMLIDGLLDKFSKRHKNMDTYSQDYYNTFEVKDFKTRFSLDLTNLVFNILIMVLMVVQLFMYMDTKSALLKQSWKDNQKIQTIYTYENIKEEIITTLNLTVTSKTVFTGAISFEFLGPNDDPGNYSSIVEYLPNNPEFADISGKVTSYTNSGWFLKGVSNTDYAAMMNIFKNMDLFDFIQRVKLQAIVMYGLYFVPAYDMWILRTNLYEFPKDDDIKFSLRITPAKIQNLKNQSSMRKLILDILNMVMQLVLGIIKFFCAFRQGETSLGIYFMTFNMIILALLLIANLLYFDMYKGRDIQIGNIGFFSEINNRVNLSKQLTIICLLLHSYQTFFSLKINSTCVYILAVIGYQQSWLWPLVVQYALVIIVFTFLVDNIIKGFNLSISDMPVAIFRTIANSNTKYWQLIINGSPVYFIIIVIIALFWIFYIINNIYFGIQCEIVRMCEIAKQGKQMGLWSEIKDIIKKFRKKKPAEGEEGEENQE